MRRHSLLLAGPRDLRWIEDDLANPGGGEVLVETVAGAISVGSELPLVRGDARSASPPTYPRMTGYESLGVIRSVGARVPNLREGDRVVATYGHRTAAVIPAGRAIPVPAPIPDDLALLAILTCDVAKGIGKLDPQPSQPVLVTGAGAIGLLTVWSLAVRGLVPVDVVEPNPTRRSLAERLGARCAVPQTDRPPAFGHYAAGFECSSSSAAFELLQDALTIGGRICILADGNREPLVLAPTFHEKELSIVGSSDGLDYPSHARWFFATIGREPGALADLFDLRIPVDDLAATFSWMAAGELRPIKVFVNY